MNLQSLRVTETDLVTTIHLDRLDNGLVTMAALSELTSVLHYLEDESKCRFVVFRGAPECFCRGLDIDHFYPRKIDYDGFRKWENVLRYLDKLNKISVAVIEGACNGAGIDLALTCDVRIATAAAAFSHDEASRGILPGQTTFQLGKFCGLGRILELIQTGRAYSGREALDIGLVNRCLAADQLEAGVAEMMRAYEAINVDVLVLTRRLLKESYSIAYDDFIGSYLAAQHRVLSKPAGSRRIDHDEANII